MRNLEKIISVLNNNNARCDDCLSKEAKVKPRQQVNMICRQLVDDGKLIRQTKACPVCAGWKIVNRLCVN